MVFYQVCSNQGPSFLDCPGARGSKVETIEIHSKILQNLLLQNHLAQMIEISYVALSSISPTICSDGDPGVQDGPGT